MTMIKTIAKVNKRVKKTELRDWIDQQYRREPDLRKQVDELIAEMEIEQGLVALREARGVSQTVLARLIGVRQPAIAKLESGRAKNVELRTLARYVAALGGRLRIEVAPRRVSKVLSLHRAAAKR